MLIIIIIINQIGCDIAGDDFDRPVPELQTLQRQSQTAHENAQSAQVAQDS